MSIKSSYLDNYPSQYGVFRNLFVFHDIRNFLNSQQVWKNGPFIRKGNISCRLRFRNNIDRGHVGLYVEWKPEGVDGEQWVIRARPIFKFINQRNEIETRGYALNFFGDPFVPFENDRRMIGHPLVMPIETVLDETQGFLKHDSVKIVLDVHVNEIEGFYSPRMFNFYQEFEKEAETSHIFSVMHDIHTIRYNKTLPTIHSMYFPDFFAYNNFDKWNIYEFELFLQLLHGQHPEIQDVSQVLQFAKCCNVNTVVRRCEDLIIRSYSPRIPTEYFQLAIKQNLRRVLHAYFRSIRSFNKRLLGILDIYGMSGETMKTIINGIFGLYDEQMMQM